MELPLPDICTYPPKCQDRRVINIEITEEGLKTYHINSLSHCVCGSVEGKIRLDKHELLPPPPNPVERQCKTLELSDVS